MSNMKLIFTVCLIAIVDVCKNNHIAVDSN
jgi:hypothetical protein